MVNFRNILKNNNKIYKFYLLLRSMKNKIESRKQMTYSDKDLMELLSEEYHERTGEFLDWDNLKTYNEKMQWAKIFDKDPLKVTLSDKFEVREWVSKKIGSQYLIPLIGVWDSTEELKFEELPDKFVLKTNNASGTNIIVKNKENFDIEQAKIQLNYWLKLDYSAVGGFQLQYKYIKPKILAEKFMADKNSELNDYKFLCFDGKVYYCWVDSERYTEQKRNVYDLEWNLQPWNQNTFSNTDIPLDKPQNFEEMVQIAEKLCEGFPHVRVDLYNIDGQIYFGEMTFTSGNGYSLIEPYQYNLMLGTLWNVPHKIEY